ncbi:MAG TPA: SEC-C metal-binding domain-containing protein, partial [Anaerolineae bacterium]
NGLNDKQRNTLKSILSRSLDDAPENYDEALSSRLFHEYDLRAVIEASRRLSQPVRELARNRPRLARSEKERANVARQFNWDEKKLKELEGLGKRDLEFAARLEDRQLRLDTAETLLTEISNHPDDLAKIAPRFNLPIDAVMNVYEDLRLQRSEMIDINRALIDGLGDVEQVADENRVRSADMEVIVKRLFLKDEDVTRLAKKLGANADPFAPENIEMLRPIFGIEDGQSLSTLLNEGVPHSVLNAKEHEKEGHVIARAGEPHTITIATNMAGRGVDIKLGGELPEETVNEVGRILHRNGIDPYNLSFDQIAEALKKIPEENYALDKEHVDRFIKYMHDRAQVRELGGLRIIGTERHEARRIDNQLRGRSGRQGDAGSSRFYVSLEDEIMRRMGGKGLVDRVWIEDIPIEHSWVTGAIEQAQVKMESYNFDIRKHLLEYDDVLNKQREVIYGQRYRILTKADLREDLRSWLEEEIERILGEDLKGEYAESRLLLHLDALLPGFLLNENEIWPPFSLAQVERDMNGSDNASAISHKVLDAARRAMELQRDYVTEVTIPEVINQFEQDYKAKWDEIEDLAKNTLQTAQQEAAEQNRRLDSRTMLLTASQAVGMTVDVRVDRGEELNERDILQAIHTAFDARVVDQVARRLEKRVGVNLPLEWPAGENLNFDALRDEMIRSFQEVYNQQADKYLADIERELGERVKSIEDVRGMRLSNLMFGISHTRHAIFDQRSHRRGEIMIPRFTWVHLAAQKIKGMPQDQLREEILAYWNQSLDLLEPLRGGAQAFNDLLRELMLSIVTNLWVDYLTDIEALRQGIGLQAFGQRDPLVEYKRRAFEMFQDLYRRIRSQVVSYVFTYQYRGFARLEEEDRDRASRKAIEAPRPERAAAPAVAKPAAQPKSTGTERQKETAQASPARAGVGAATAKLGRNDPCWCGSGKKYKNCHMHSDMGQGAPTHMAGNGKRRR